MATIAKVGRRRRPGDKSFESSAEESSHPDAALCAEHAHADRLGIIIDIRSGYLTCFRHRSHTTSSRKRRRR